MRPIWMLMFVIPLAACSMFADDDDPGPTVAVVAMAPEPLDIRDPVFVDVFLDIPPSSIASEDLDEEIPEDIGARLQETALPPVDPKPEPAPSTAATEDEPGC